MPIRSIADLRGAVGKDWNDVSDEDLIKSYADSIKLDPVNVARELGYDVGTGGMAAKRLTSSVSNYVGGLQGVGEEIAGGLGLSGAQNYLAEKRRANELQAQVASSRARDMGAVESYKEVDTVGKGLNYLGGLVVQSFPYAIEAATGGLEARALMGGTRAALSEARAALVAAEAAKDTTEVARATQAVKQAERSLDIGSGVGVAAQSYPSAVGDILQNQREQTGGKTDLGSAALYGAGYTGLNVMGVGGALGRGTLFRNTIDFLDRPGGITGGLARAGATAVGTGVKEGLSETGQEMFNQAGRMAVDDKAQFFDQEAQERYKESFVGGFALGGAMGGALGGYRRSEGYQAGNDVQQAFTQPQTSGTPITGQTPPAPPGTTVTAPPAPPNMPPGQTGAPITPPSAPAVVGGTTAVAQASQQQTQADFAAQQQQAIQDQREVIINQFGLRGENPSVGQFFNRPIFGPAINQVADALAPIAAKLDQQEATVMDAIVQADKATGGKLVNFKFNGDKIPQSVQKGVEAVLAVANKFQIGHVASVDEAGEILNTLSQSAKGAELEQINAIHQVLTGKDTEGYVTAQAPKPTKGKSNARQQQQLPEQVPTGLGTVSEQGGTVQGNGGLTGLLQPGAVQPIGTGSDVGTAISQQAGQPSGEGIRPSAGIAADNGSPVLTPQVTGVPSETGTTIQDTVGGGQTSGQSIQANQSDVDRPVVQRRKRRTIIGAQQYAPGLQYYASDLSHISSRRRIEIIQQLLLSVLAPARDNTVSAKDRAKIVRLALLEQFSMNDIAKFTKIKLDTVSKQLQRLGIALKDGEFQVVRPLFAEKLVAQAEAFRSPEFPDGIGAEELKGFYATRYEGTEQESENDEQESENGEQEGDRSKLLNEERFGGETGEGKSMGTIGSAGGSQGAVDSAESKAFTQAEELQVMLAATPDTDVEGKENLTKQLAAAWERYAKEQKDRAKAGETKVRYREEKAAELGETEGEEDAVQVESADEGDVQEPAGGGEEVGKANAEPKKPARARKAKAESKPAEEAKPEIKTAEEQWTALADQFPQMPPYATLNKDEKIRWDDVAERGVANLAAANTILSTVVKAAPTEKVEAPAAAGTTEAVEQPKFGVARAVKNPYTAAELMADIKNFIRADILGNKLIIVDSVSDLIRHPDADLRAVGKAVGDKGAYGVAANGKAYLIANRIEQGQGRAKFMHEVGAHLGLENLLPKMVYDKLASQIDTWAKADNGSVESKLAKAAQARVEAANTPAEDRQSEMLAYFVEEAVQSGIDPTAAGKESAALQSWFRTLWAAFKVAIRRLGFKTETLTAQDIVNLAFGAARLEITGTWHGTAADFRKFSHAFMSSGEGAQAFGWGTYLAQRVGVAKGYWTEDVNRKTQGVKGLQIEPTNGVPLNRKEKMVLTQIEHGGVHHNGWKDELRNRYVPYWTKELAKAKDAYDWVKSGLPRGGRNNAEYYQGIISQLSELLNGTESLLAPGRAELRIEPKKVEGSLMRVDTSVSDNEMIDWDAPIANQPQIVKEFIKQIVKGTSYEYDLTAYKIKTGGDIYKYLLAKFYKEAGNTGKWDYAEKQTKLEIKKAVSQYLDAHGIKGHKFFDQLSRNNGAVDVLAKRIVNDEKFLATLKDRDADHWSEVTQAPMTEKARVATIEMVEENIASLKNDLAKEQANRTQNTVIYNDKNIFRVGSETAADKQRMKFGFVGLKGLAQRGMTPKEEGRFLNAKLMDATGELRSDIWYDTGWLRGADGQWRTEISDKDAKLKASLPNFGTGKLGDLLDHSTLYKLYPQLTGYTLVVDPQMEPNSAAFIPEQQEIRMAAVQNSPVTALLHEVQHAIQEIEGFGKGANPAEMDMFNVNAANKFAAASHVFGYVSPETQEAIAKYRDAIEAKHLAVVARDTGDFKTVAEERAAVQRTMDTDKAARRALGEMLSVLGSTEGEFKERLYRMVSGEIEARDVEARRQYSDALRRQVVPGEAEGFTPETQLVYDKASNSYMKFGVNGKTADEHAREQISKLPPKWQPAARTVTTTLMHTLKKAGLASMITEDVIGAATKYMKSAQNYLTAQYARQATRLAHELKIEKILQQHDKLPENLKGTGRGSVNEYIHDSTREGLWGYYPDARMVGTTMAKIDPGFKARFDAFPAAAQKLIKDVFEQGHDSLVAKQKAVTDAINREYADRASDVLGDADLTAELNKEKNLRIARESKLMGLDGSKPYAYMGRYGDYVVVGKSAEYKHHEEQAKAGPMVKGEYVYGSESQKWLGDNRSNPAHYVVQFAETLDEADQIAEQLNATGNYDIAESFEKEPYSQEGGEMFAAVARLRNLYERESDGDNPAAAKAIRNLLGDLYLHTVSEASARKSEFQRLNISGSDKDMMRNLATRGRADAHFLAALQHNDAISDAITGMREERNRNRREATPYFNELLKRHANSMKYETPGVLSSALLRMSTVWYLSTNPAFYLQQILQTGTLSLPYMAGRLGYFRSARAIKLAYSDMATLVKGLGVSDHVDFEKAPADVRAMLNTLVGMGKIDIGIDSDSAARAGDTGVIAAVMQKLQGVNNRIETINRATAAIAAYRGYLDRYKNNDTAAATKYAAEVVSNTHGSYDAFNTPRIMSTGAGKVLLQFKRFQIIQISMLAKLLTTAFKGASAEEKTVARHSLAFIAGQMGVLGGVMAVPFAQQAASILAGILGDPDEPDNWEFKLRRMIDDKAVADLLISGVPGAMGVDLSSKIGLGNVFSVLPFTDIDFTSRAGAEKVIVGLMGPTASLGLKFIDGLGLMSQGDYYKGLEQMLPNGVANVLKSGRFATEGITMRNGDVVLKPEEISMLDAAFQAVGLPTNTITDRQFTQKVVKEFDKYYKQRDTEIKGDYVEASRKGDSASMGDAIDEWNKLQASRVANGYKRQPYSDLYKAPMAAIKREQNVSGGVEFTKSNRQLIESLSTI